ncbi:hypothetical protein CC86DRAFT_380498 [Ophiobolus disseminans]|uniref:Uncharacterized protein n=1 Tax=Ophiobolus disseminans TaxID=1469910 RepID=A0A6A7A5Z5_9PLEO|nr:hypothetical protein CC86DRAFT_380498 [Ophiobolus disseminans]
MSFKRAHCSRAREFRPKQPVRKPKVVRFHPHHFANLEHHPHVVEEFFDPEVLKFELDQKNPKYPKDTFNLIRESNLVKCRLSDSSKDVQWAARLEVRMSEVSRDGVWSIKWVTASPRFHAVLFNFDRDDLQHPEDLKELEAKELADEISERIGERRFWRLEYGTERVVSLRKGGSLKTWKTEYACK